MSKVMDQKGSAAYFLCHFCGLCGEFGREKFHDMQTVGRTQRCDSGLQNNRRDKIATVVKRLEGPKVDVSVADATTEQFQYWLGDRGWLGCPWANMVTLFIVLREPSMLEQACAFAG
ncbi:hypothetical protein DFH28DRAFT_939273 [Melampsora americana]|nr:hypothetical protein DFH28DRAFT_939273 [Melampsora americana]